MHIKCICLVYCISAAGDAVYVAIHFLYYIYEWQITRAAHAHAICNGVISEAVDYELRAPTAILLGLPRHILCASTKQ